MIPDYTNYNLSYPEKQKFFLLAYTSLFGLSLLFYHSLIFSAAAGLLAIFGFKQYSRYLAEKRRAELTVQFKDLLYSLSASIAAGRQMAEALGEALENLSFIYKPDSPIIAELDHMVRSISENRDNEEHVLMDFARRSGVEDIRNFVNVYLTCRTTGGDLEAALSKASEILIDKMTIEKEIRTLTAQKQLEGRIISAMPILIVLFLNLLSPEYLEVLYTTPAGRLIMTLALVGIGFAYCWIMKLTKIEV